MYLRFVASVAALGAGAAAVVVAAVLLRGVPGPAPTSSSSVAAAAPAAPAPAPARPAIEGGRVATPTRPHFPSPPPGAVVLAREAGTRDLALAVEPGLVRVSVVTGDGVGATGLRVSLRTGGRTLQTSGCGAGCYQAVVRGTPSSPVTVLLGAASYRFDLPKLPAPDASAIVASATKTWSALRTLVWHEALGASPTDVLHTTYRVVAPDELEYTVKGQSSAIIIGGTRWDRPSPTAPWQKSVQDPPVDEPQPFWRTAVDAHVLARTTLHGHPVWRVSFFDPGTPGWFDAAVDRETHRTLQLDMIAAAHFMHHVYGPFDAPITISPPHVGQ